MYCLQCRRIIGNENITVLARAWVLIGSVPLTRSDYTSPLLIWDQNIVCSFISRLLHPWRLIKTSAYLRPRHLFETQALIRANTVCIVTCLSSQDFKSCVWVENLPKSGYFLPLHKSHYNSSKDEAERCIALYKIISLQWYKNRTAHLWFLFEVASCMIPWMCILWLLVYFFSGC